MCAHELDYTLTKEEFEKFSPKTRGFLVNKYGLDNSQPNIPPECNPYPDTSKEFKEYELGYFMADELPEDENEQRETKVPKKPDRILQLAKVQNEALELFRKKNADYGDSFAEHGPVGVIIRMGDKIKRLTSIAKSGIQLVNDEGIRDTLMDLHNYSAMAIMLLDDKD